MPCVFSSPIAEGTKKYFLSSFMLRKIFAKRIFSIPVLLRVHITLCW